MDIAAEAIVCAVLAHGEHGAVVRFLIAEHGLVAGYVRGARSRKLRPLLQPGNLVQAQLRSRVEEQLAAATVELIASRAPLAAERMAAAALDWVTALTAATLPEQQVYRRIHAALAALLELMDHADDERQWAASLARYELLLLTELGFGPDLSCCAATGVADDLAYVSPKSSKAVSRDAGAPYAAKLLPLPGFLIGTAGTPDWSDIAAGLRTTGHFLERDLLADRRRDILPARERFVTRVKARYEQNI